MSEHTPREEQPLRESLDSGAAERSTTTTEGKTAHQGGDLSQEKPAAPQPARARPLTHEEIALRAYEIWVAKGRPDRTDCADWFEAEQQLRALLNNSQRDGR